MRIPLPADAPVKFFDLFGKSPDRAVKNVRTPAAPADDQRRATVRKIDAIESEMSAELEAQTQVIEHDESAQRLEERIAEASILYASRQSKAAERLLLESVAYPTNDAQEHVAWMMLLELAGFDDDQPRFEALSLRYAERFETSPPQWRTPAATTASNQDPTLAFRGKLLDSSAPALAQFEQMAQAQSRFVLDLRGVTEVDDAGCAALLALFRRWDAQRKQVYIAPAPPLVTLLRSATESEGKLSGDGTWCLLIELLRISGDERAYEDACIHYSMTFEVSPPAPSGSIAAPASGRSALCLPREVVMPVDALLGSLRTASDSLNAVVLDCRQLQLVEFHAAAAFLEGVAGLAKGKPVEWREIPYLVSTLLLLVGGNGKFSIINRQP